MKRTLIPILVAVVALVATTVHAQTVVNPKTAQFTPSPDDGKTGLNGQPLLDHYDLHANTAAPIGPDVVVPIGHPTPDATNTIVFTLPAAFLTALVPNMVYTGQVYAVAPDGGHTASSPSNPFGRQGPPSPAANVVVK